MLVRSLMATLLALPLLGCSLFEGSAWVYVDNGGASPIEVSVDGGDPMTAPVKGVAVIKLRAGSHRFLVRRGGEVLYDQSTELPDTPTVATYVLNPDGSNRYTSKVVKYRPSSWGGANLPLLPFQALQQAVVLKPDPWVTGAFDHVLDEAPPAESTTKQNEEPRSLNQLCRIPAADYDLVSSAKVAAAKDPGTDVDSKVVDALERVLKACPGPSYR